MNIEQAIEQLAERNYLLDPVEAERVKKEDRCPVMYVFTNRVPSLARCVHCYCYSQADVYRLLDSFERATTVTSAGGVT